MNKIRKKNCQVTTNRFIVRLFKGWIRTYEYSVSNRKGTNKTRMISKTENKVLKI